MLKDTFRVLRQYQALAPENARSLWPIYGFWLFSIPALCAGAAAGLYFNLPPTSANNVSAHFPSISAALWWVSVSSFLIALVFSRRVFRDLSDHGTTLWGWKRWGSDAYTRNDFALASMSWVGSLEAYSRFICCIAWHKPFRSNKELKRTPRFEASQSPEFSGVCLSRMCYFFISQCPPPIPITASSGAKLLWSPAPQNAWAEPSRCTSRAKARM